MMNKFKTILTTGVVAAFAISATQAALPVSEQTWTANIVDEAFAFDLIDGVGVNLPQFDPTSVAGVNPTLVSICVTLEGVSTVSYSLFNQTGSPQVYAVTGNSEVTLESPYMGGPQLAIITPISAADVPSMDGVAAAGSLPTTGDIDDREHGPMDVDFMEFIGNGSLFFPMTGAGNGSADGDLPFLAGFTGVASATVTITYKYTTGIVPEANALYAMLVLGVPLIGFGAYRRFRSVNA